MEIIAEEEGGYKIYVRRSKGEKATGFRIISSNVSKYLMGLYSILNAILYKGYN